MKARLINDISGSFLDYPDNSSISMGLFFTGCWGYCDNCQNKELQNPNYKINTKLFTIDELLIKIFSNAKRFQTNKISLMGGDPLFDSNIEFTKILLKILYETTNFKTCLYTGQSLDFVKKNNIDYFTYLKCGWYDRSKGVLSEKTDEYFQLASTNQELYDSEFNLLSENGRYYFK